jgi:hypothetical protein
MPIHTLRPAELAAAAEPGLSWLWHGYLAQGKVTALIAPPKSGKTTLVSHLFARFGNGGQLAGLEVKPARTLIVSEESSQDWSARCQKLAIGRNIQFLCRPFKGLRPTEAQWCTLIAGIEALHRKEGLDLVVIDALATLLPGFAESSAPKLLDCLLPLQNLAHQGPGVCILHHPAKRNCVDGQSARGSSALSGFTDIVMELSCVTRARSRDRRRRINAYSRYIETPRHLIIELNADGSDYLVRTDARGTPLVQDWPEVRYLLELTDRKLTVHQMIEQWPSSEKDPPDRSTLSRWLQRAFKQGLVCREGSGYKYNSFRYWLHDNEPYLWPGESAPESEKQAWRDRLYQRAQARRQQQS